MPYNDVKELPDEVSKLPAHAKQIWMKAFNSAYSQYKEDDKAFKVAWSAVKQTYVEKENGWEKKSEDTYYMTFNEFTSCEIKSDGDLYVKGYLLEFDKPDFDRDVFTKECVEDIKAQILGSNVSLVVGYEHEHVLKDSRILPVAKLVEVDIDDKGLIGTSKVNKHINEALPGLYKMVKGSIEDGYLQGYSIEFKPTDWSGIKGINRKLNRVRIGGLAYTGKPAQPGALFTDWYIKSLATYEADVETQKTEVATMTEEIKEVTEQPTKIEQPVLQPEPVAEPAPIEEKPVETAEPIEAPVKAPVVVPVEEAKSVEYVSRAEFDALKEELKSIMEKQEKENKAEVVANVALEEIKAKGTEMPKNLVPPETKNEALSNMTKSFADQIYDKIMVKH